MPYYITDKSTDCNGWAVVIADGTVFGCHKTKQGAIDQALAISLAEDEPFMGELNKRELRATYIPPQGVQTAAKRALKWIADGKAGSGFTSVGRRRATQLANGEPVSDTTIARMRSYFARHEVDKQATGFNNGEEGFPTPGRVAWDAWGGDAGKSWANSFDSSTRKLDGERIIICDIDGTIINGGRLVQRVWDYVQSLDGKVFIVTGRAESDRTNTERELRQLGVRFSRLIMNDGSTASSPEYKKETAKKLLETYNVVEAIENNPTALRNYRELGIKAVNPSTIRNEQRSGEYWPLLNERQQTQAEDLSELALEYGQFDQSTGANGAHYAPADKNPFKAEGLVCDNCVFYNEITRQCQIVEGDIDPEAVCKLWVIPESKIGAGANIETDQTEDVPMSRNKWADAANLIVNRLEGEQRSVDGREVRTIHSELRSIGDGMTFEGYAAVFNSPSEPLPFIEYVAPGAFTRSLKSRNRMMLLWNHNTSEPLASTRNGSLKLVQDERGLKVTATLPDTTRGRDVAELVRTGVIDSMSFGFSVRKDSWSSDGSTRTLQDVTLFEVSLVSQPAYEGTAGTTTVRSIDADKLAESLAKLEAGENLDADQAELLKDVVTKLAPTPEVVSDETDESAEGILALAKAKVSLLEKIG